MSDRDEIKRALRLLFADGDVFEIRVLKATTGGYQRPHTESGYFDYEHIPQAAEAICRLRSYAGAYVTLNPVAPELMARAFNRLGPAEQNATTADTDTVCRRWLPIDCDAKRKSNISSTDEEHEAALKLAREIRDDLASIGWPEPVMLDSGNGAQIIYRIDLPADDDGLVQRFIKQIGWAANDRVEIDPAVYNPARIWRLPGTMNCKGDSIPERPHRQAKIISAPEQPEIVSIDLINKVLENEPAEEVVLKDESGFDLDSWIAEHLPNLGSASPWKGGRKWVFPVCPFNSDHSNGSAVLIEEPSGAIAFRCHHNSCTGNDWHKLRELYEPGCYDVHQEYPEVDLSGLMNKWGASTGNLVAFREEIATHADEHPWRNITTEEIAEVIKDTALGELADIYASVTSPPLPLEAALMKAVVTAACCLSGEDSPDELKQRYGGGNLAGVTLIGADRARVKINTSGGQLCNAYGMIVAPSATGKDIGGLIGKFMRMENPDLYHIEGQSVERDWNLASSSSSAEGLAGILVKKPNGLLAISELSAWLDPRRWQHNAADFLTEAFGQGFFDQTFSDRSRPSNCQRRTNYCAPNIIGSIQPGVFNDKVSMLDVDTGFLGRFLMTRLPEYYGNPVTYDGIKKLADLRQAIEPYLAKHDVVNLEDGYSVELQNVFKGRTDPNFVPSWRRLCNEYYPRLMVMLSVNNDIRTRRREVIITDEVKKKAEKLILWFFAQTESILSGIIPGEGNGRILEKGMKRLLNIVVNSGKKGVNLREISHKASGSGTTAANRQELLIEMVERGWIRLDAGRYSALNPPLDFDKLKKKT